MNGSYIEGGLAQRARLLDALAGRIPTDRNGCSLKASRLWSRLSVIRTISGLAKESNRTPGTSGRTFTRLILLRARWALVVLADRTHVLSGAGYALETRLIVGQGAA